MALSLKHARTQLDDAYVRQLIQLLANRLFANFGVRDVDVEPDEDHDGDPIISVVLRHDFLDRAVDFKELFPLNRQIRDEVWKAGERRFVHISHKYDDRQQFADIQ